MIDLHCHILPGIDDGAKNLEDSIAMAKSAVDQGITHILCTPHHNNGKYVNEANKVITAVDLLQKELDERKIPLMLFEGQEVRINGDLLSEIENQLILFADLNNQYVLIEFPTHEIPAYAEKLFLELLRKGHTPIIVHPERNSKFIESPNKLLPFLEMGVLTQLTAPSYTGVFGRTIQKIAKQMVSHNLVYMMASDAHNTGKRDFFMQKAYQSIEKDMGVDYVQAMKQMACDILNGDTVCIPDYREIHKKKFMLF